MVGRTLVGSAAFVVAGLLAGDTGLAHGTRDQVNLPEQIANLGCAVGQGGLSQTFTPSVSPLVAVDLRVLITDGVSSTVRIEDAAGAVLAESTVPAPPSSVRLPRIVHFDLPRPVPVLVERPYRIEWVPSQASGWSFGSAFPARDQYPRGAAYDCGREPMPNSRDFSFVTYSGAAPSPPPPPPTPPSPPPAPPPAAPAAYGVVADASITRIANGLAATFVFRSLPKSGAKVKTTWLYNNRFAGERAKRRTRVVTSTVTASRGLPKGFWRCVLKVKVGARPWRPVREARTRLR